MYNINKKKTCNKQILKIHTLWGHKSDLNKFLFELKCNFVYLNHKQKERSCQA